MTRKRKKAKKPKVIRFTNGSTLTIKPNPPGWGKLQGAKHGWILTDDGWIEWTRP